MERVFAVLRSRGPAWDDSKPLEGQVDWARHAKFMDGLYDEGFAALVGCASPILRPAKIRLTAGWKLAILRAMRRIVQTVAAIRFARSTRRDLLLEALALRHQLGVLARSNRRFRSADRLLWLILRCVWPRWRDALMLVQPATVDRWYHDGFSRWWSRRTRRPGRPRIDAECRQLIQEMATENHLWGAPRIHGELVKLGIAVSERTVSRYLRQCPRGSSQTWRTFLANHYNQLRFISPEWSAPGADDVIKGAGLTCRHTP
jgi:Homeodomain-like domain